MTVPTGTVQDVLDWVGDDPERAQEALDAEYVGQNRSTLVSQLESIAAKEANDVTETTAPDGVDYEDGADEETGLAPGPEQPEEIIVDANDPATSVVPTVLAHSGVEDPGTFDVVEGEEGEPEHSLPEGVELVESMSAVVAPHGFVLVINGQAFAFSPTLTASLKTVMDKATAGVVN